VYDHDTGDISIQLTTTAANYEQFATDGIRAVMAKRITQGSMTAEIYFERVGVLKFTAPFGWTSLATFKNLDKVPVREAKAKVLRQHPAATKEK
jgi:hypothetical protein